METLTHDVVADRRWKLDRMSKYDAVSEPYRRYRGRALLWTIAIWVQLTENSTRSIVACETSLAHTRPIELSS